MGIIRIKHNEGKLLYFNHSRVRSVEFSYSKGDALNLKMY